MRLTKEIDRRAERGGLTAAFRGRFHQVRRFFVHPQLQQRLARGQQRGPAGLVVHDSLRGFSDRSFSRLLSGDRSQQQRVSRAVAVLARHFPQFVEPARPQKRVENVVLEALGELALAGAVFVDGLAQLLLRFITSAVWRVLEQNGQVRAHVVVLRIELDGLAVGRFRSSQVAAFLEAAAHQIVLQNPSQSRMGKRG